MLPQFLRDDLDTAAEVQQKGLISDNRELQSRGIEPVTVEALPFYAAWIRSDLVLCASLLARIAAYLKIASCALVAIAIVLLFRLH